MRRTPTPAAVAAGALAALLLAGCGSAPAGGGSVQHMPAAAVLPLATSVTSQAGVTFAVAELGGPSDQHDNFWELFVRLAGTTGWKLATPPGVASNGGLVLAGAADSMVTAFGPSQRLTFSPLAATIDEGRTWSQGNLVSPGVASTPDALAAGPAGQLLALTDAGLVKLGAHLGASWRPVTSRAALAASTAGRACGLTKLSAVAFSAAGLPLVGGSCSKPGAAALFASLNGSWQPLSLTLPAALAHDPVSVLGLATVSGRTTALLSAGHGASAELVAAWLAETGSSWTFSPVLRAGAPALTSLSLWPGGAAGLVFAGSRGETIAGPGASWQQLAALPARTQTLALGPAGQLEALAGHSGTFTAWQLGTGSGVTPAAAGTGSGGWQLLQTMKIPIPYGSSG